MHRSFVRIFFYVMILVAPDKFKGSLTAYEVAGVIRQSILNHNSSLTIIEQPVADGGEGTAELLTHATHGHLITETVSDPLGRPIEATYGVSGDGKTAFIEMAKASGLVLLLHEERNPLLTSTVGTGELINSALRRGVQTVVLCIGGSATNDGGIGMASALGYRFLDASGQLLPSVGGTLKDIATINTDYVPATIRQTTFVVACDVDNPLCGSNGASAVYGPQKGADAIMVQQLDSGLQHLAELMHRQLGHDCSMEPGSGAAGGLGFGARAFLNARLESGFSIVAHYLKLDQLIAQSTLIITGEGKLDEQTLSGKVISGITRLAKQQDIPVIAFCGRLDLNANQLQELGLANAYEVTPNDMPFTEAVSKAKELLATKVQDLATLFFQ